MFIIIGLYLVHLCKSNVVFKRGYDSSQQFLPPNVFAGHINQFLFLTLD